MENIVRVQKRRIDLHYAPNGLANIGILWIAGDFTDGMVALADFMS